MIPEITYFNLNINDRLGDLGPEKGLLLATDVSTTNAKGEFDFQDGFCTSCRISVANNSPSEDYSHPDDHFQSRMSHFPYFQWLAVHGLSFHKPALLIWSRNASTIFIELKAFLQL